MKTDLRPSLPEAVKDNYVWVIDGERYNFLRSANKFGEECGCVRISGSERFAKYRAGSYFMVGVFLAVNDTDPNF